MAVLGQQPLKNLGSVQTDWAFCYFPSVRLTWELVSSFLGGYKAVTMTTHSTQNVKEGHREPDQAYAQMEEGFVSPKNLSKPSNFKASLPSPSSEVCKWRIEAQRASSKCSRKSVGGILTQPAALSIASSFLEGISRDLSSYCTVKFVHF